MFRPAEAKLVAAIGDLDAEAQFDLAQVFVERTAQIGQTFAVIRIERDFAVGQGSHAEADSLMALRIERSAPRLKHCTLPPCRTVRKPRRPGDDQTQAWTFRARDS